MAILLWFNGYVCPSEIKNIMILKKYVYVAIIGFYFLVHKKNLFHICSIFKFWVEEMYIFLDICIYYMYICRYFVLFFQFVLFYNLPICIYMECVYSMVSINIIYIQYFSVLEKCRIICGQLLWLDSTVFVLPSNSTI